VTNAYEAPEVRDFGSLVDLTEQSFNKVGPSPDVLTQINQDVIGSFTPFP
jgi:hypothetical protein